MSDDVNISHDQLSEEIEQNNVTIGTINYDLNNLQNVAKLPHLSAKRKLQLTKPQIDAFEDERKRRNNAATKERRPSQRSSARNSRASSVATVASNVDRTFDLDDLPNMVRLPSITAKRTREWSPERISAIKAEKERRTAANKKERLKKEELDQQQLLAALSRSSINDINEAAVVQPDEDVMMAEDVLLDQLNEPGNGSANHAILDDSNIVKDMDNSNIANDLNDSNIVNDMNNGLENQIDEPLPDNDPRDGVIYISCDVVNICAEYKVVKKVDEIILIDDEPDERNIHESQPEDLVLIDGRLIDFSNLPAVKKLPYIGKHIISTLPEYRVKALREEKARRNKVNQRKRYAKKADEINERRREHHFENANEINEQRLDEINEKRRELHVENADAINEQRHAYRAQNADAINEQRQQYRGENADAINEQRQQYRGENADAINEQRQQYRGKNADAINEQRQQYRGKNADVINEQQRKRHVENADVLNEKRREEAKNYKGKPTNQLCPSRHGNFGCAAESVGHAAAPFEVGPFTMFRCATCKALLLEYEYLSRARPCCGKGKVDMDAHFKILQNPGNLIKTLTDPDHPIGKKYLKKPRAYNRQASFGTLKVGTERSPPGGAVAVRMNGQMDILLSDLWCQQNQTPSHGQLYSMLPSESQEIRSQAATDQGLDPEITTLIDNEIPHAVNITDPGIHSHRTEVPTAEQVGIMWDSNVGNPPKTRGVLLNGRDGHLVRMHPLNPNVDPALYPLLYTRGNQGYRLGI
uniref:Uncharacterized protein n=1 Tax=Panagrolaimus sp. ES5 TaxID=591445 RepID=A0AC34GVC6_9BILA